MSTETKAAIPAIGKPWPEQGGIYIGARLINGAIHHIIIADGGTTRDLKDQDSKAAQNAKFEINGHSDWHAGDQEDHMLAYVNARGHFKQEGRDSIYWTRSEYHGYPWSFDFERGRCYDFYRDYEFRVRPFRSFSDSPL